MTKAEWQAQYIGSGTPVHPDGACADADPLPGTLHEAVAHGVRPGKSQGQFIEVTRHQVDRRAIHSIAGTQSLDACRTHAKFECRGVTSKHTDRLEDHIRTQQLVPLVRHVWPVARERRGLAVGTAAAPRVMRRPVYRRIMDIHCVCGLPSQNNGFSSKAPIGCGTGNWVCVFDCVVFDVHPHLVLTVRQWRGGCLGIPRIVAGGVLAVLLVPAVLAVLVVRVMLRIRHRSLWAPNSMKSVRGSGVGQDGTIRSARDGVRGGHREDPLDALLRSTQMPAANCVTPKN